MGQVKYTLQAQAKIASACAFYTALDEKLGERAMATIATSIDKLAEHPKTGRPFLENLNYRERVIPFGSSHFLALYRINDVGDVVVVSLRHEREVGYELEDDT
jgi:plasmid stabilization system protein ParE